MRIASLTIDYQDRSLVGGGTPTMAPRDVRLSVGDDEVPVNGLSKPVVRVRDKSGNCTATVSRVSNKGCKGILSDPASVQKVAAVRFDGYDAERTVMVRRVTVHISKFVGERPHDTRFMTVDAADGSRELVLSLSGAGAAIEAR